MAKKKEKESKFIQGRDIQHFDFYHTWITCTLYNGEKVSISGRILFKLLDQFDLHIEKYGDHFRTIGFESNDNFGKIDYQEN
jgi:hypothetical protein